MVVLAALVGVVTGLLVAGFEAVVRDGAFEAVMRRPLRIAMWIPLAGLAATALVRRLSGSDGRTTDAYVIAYHQRGGEMRLRDLPATVLASALTLGSGTGMGYEGPAMLIGGTVGSFAERRFTWRFRQDDAKILMVAGAAAGVAAVFKAPLTGMVFALEVPYTQDLARRALLPALIAASTSYLTFVAFLGTAPVLSIGGVSPFELRDLAGAIALGVLSGLLARLGAWAIAAAKGLRAPIVWRIVGFGLALAGLAVWSDRVFGGPLTMGSGYGAIEWTRAHEQGVALLALLFAMRFASTWCTVAAGGVGGLFIPLVCQGAVLGGFMQSIVHAQNGALLPTVGIAAFLGAGYRTPIAGVAFVAEATGQPGFVVPALLAAAAAQLAIGRWSFTAYQRDQRQVSLTPTDEMSLGDIMSANPDTVRADMPLSESVRLMMTTNRRWVPVVDAGAYAGLLSITDAARVPADDWANTQTGSLVRTIPAARTTDSVAEAAERIRAGGVGALAVTDGERVVGVVTIRDIANVERLLELLGPDDAEDQAH